MSYGDYVEQLTCPLFLKMADERSRPPYNQTSTLKREDLDEFVKCYNPANRHDRKPTWFAKDAPHPNPSPQAGEGI